MEKGEWKMSINTDFLKNRLKQLQSRKGVQANV